MTQILKILYISFTLAANSWNGLASSPMHQLVVVVLLHFCEIAK